MSKYIIVLLVFSGVCVHCAVLKGKALYCRDPDTGKLHAVNTTWAASSFCGNYTCNIRKRNITGPVTTPIRQFNVTEVSSNNGVKNESAITVVIENKVESNIQPILHKLKLPDPKTVIYADILRLSNKNDEVIDIRHDKNKNHCKNAHKSGSPKEDDRYLTEQEIENISVLLHSVKKSDLDAIVDIYNLAEDIYNEIDKAHADGITDEAMNLMQEDEPTIRNDVKTPSYWYDPLANTAKMNKKGHTQNLITTNSAQKTNEIKEKQILYNNENNFPDEHKKTSFYYPVTQFQRESSYTHHSTNSMYKTTTQHAEILKTPALTKDSVPNNKPNENDKTETRKLIRPSHFLPYPFTRIHQYNASERNAYFDSLRLSDFYNKYKYYQPYYTAYVGPIQKAILVNPHLTNDIQDEEQHTIEKPADIKKEKQIFTDTLDTMMKGQKNANWKTGPVPIEVLKDIRADIDTSRLLKAFPLRKMIKLERVGKLFNIDDLTSRVNRSKRFVTNNTQETNAAELGEYETYVEKVTCQDKIQVGFFRIGNLSHPFPECCPQLIDIR